MLRLEISSAYTGPANYTCPVNPNIFNPEDSTQLSRLEILHGAPSWQTKYYDDRHRELVWPAYKMDNVNMSAVVTYFRSVKGEVRYFHFKDIADMNLNWPATAVSTSDSNWKYARVVNMAIKYRPGGNLRFDEIRVTLQPEVP